MRRAMSFFRSTIGKKVLMALSGVVLFGYCIGHMAGNLQIFLGAEVINNYGHMLHTTLWLLWGTRIVLLASVIVHIITAVQLVKLQAAARPVKYQMKRDVQASYASRTMRYSGPIILVFVLFHLAHLTLGWKVVPVEFAPGDVYANLVGGFRVPWVALFYVVSVSLVALHLLHGAWSMFQTVGINHPRYNLLLKGFAKVTTLIIALGFISVPIAVLLRVIGGEG